MILTTLLAYGTLMTQTAGDLNVASFGAKGDGVADNTKSFQAAFDQAARTHQNVVVGSGNFRFSGSLNIPDGVAVKGSWESVPSHNGIRDTGLPKPTDGGTTLLVEGGNRGW